MLPSARILVVDDESDTVELIRFTLRTAGFEIDEALDGASAVDKISNEDFDVILLDIMMPDLSGFDVLQQLHANDIEIPPVIFLTARKNQEDKEFGESLGASSYLTKPAKRGDLLDAIEKALDEND